jgi:DNA-binding SARP family transcriptional activator
LAFIAALAADPNGGIARERLLALLWPESDGERSRNALNQIVFVIRRDLGEEAILTDPISIRLNPAVVDSDLRIFRDALAGGRFIDAVEAYGGPFLDGVFLRETPEFERWVSDARRSFAQDYARALEQEIDAALRATPARAADAVRFARLLAVHDPLSTHTALRLMRALERSGDSAAALGHAMVYTAYLRAELESDPGPELEREIARLRTSSATVGAARSKPAQTNAPVETTTTGVAALQRVSGGGDRRRRPFTWGAFGGVITVLTLLWVAVTNGEGATRPIRTGALMQITTAQSNRGQPAISPTAGGSHLSQTVKVIPKCDSTWACMCSRSMARARFPLRAIRRWTNYRPCGRPTDYESHSRPRQRFRSCPRSAEGRRPFSPILMESACSRLAVGRMMERASPSPTRLVCGCMTFARVVRTSSLERASVRIHRRGRR